eukprot:TRINITY_DN30098_c0_g1_i1.p1 TRINITY_DN30098_c0_g1~~TRINITY_DN30098_c0_g1_i1.p1  ORF type:complete len:394 (-),score=26.90 TRINITY_DN30098_c0_g1_i1:325-1506(-)
MESFRSGLPLDFPRCQGAFRWQEFKQISKTPFGIDNGLIPLVHAAKEPRGFGNARTKSTTEGARKGRKEGNSSQTEPQAATVLPSRVAKVTAERPVPAHIQRPPYISPRVAVVPSNEVQVHRAEGIASMREVCQLAARVLEDALPLVQPGRTTDELDAAVHAMIIERGGYPSLLNYRGFSKCTSISVNNCLMNGIPDSRRLEDGDIVTIGLSVYLNGYYAHAARPVPCGPAGAKNEDLQALLKVSEECVREAVAACKPGAPLTRIGAAVSKTLEAQGEGRLSLYMYGCGHGVGKEFIAAPTIAYFRNNLPGVMMPGQTFTIGPTLVAGGSEPLSLETIPIMSSNPRSRAARLEHTVLVTADGAEILTGFITRCDDTSPLSDGVLNQNKCIPRP